MSAYTRSPQGWGTPPADYIHLVAHFNDEYVVWHKDANGWAVGYHLERYPGPR